MEFDQLFTAVQGILRSHQNSTIVHFNRVNKDNDIVSEKIIQSLQNLMKELCLKDEHKRKINLLLIVNTDFPSISTLEDDKNFWHLLGCLPQMSSYLYFRIVSELNFHSFIGEVICMCPEFISYEVLQAINDHIKLINPELAIPFLHSLYESTFHKVTYLQKKGKRPILSQKFVKLFKDVTSLNMKDLISDLSWSLEQKYIYFGYLTHMLLTLLSSCISKMKSECDISPSSQIYDFNVEYNYDKWGECNREINWTNHCLSILVAKCAEAVMSISVDIYMAWCEEDVKDSVDKTLQTAVREAAYICREEIKSISHLNDDISSLKSLETSLSNIAVQPTTEDDEIKNADAETIVINLLNPKRTQTKWLKGLIQIPGIFQSFTYMKVIQDSAHLFDLDVAKALLDVLLEFLSTSQCPRDFCEAAKEFFFTCLKKQPLPLQLDLLQYYFDSNKYSNIIERENFDEILISTLNKLAAFNEKKNEMVTEVVILCFENSELVVKTLLKECLCSELKADLLLEVLSQITPLANIPCSNSSFSLTCNSTVHLMESVITSLQRKQDSFVQLVRKLVALGLVNGNFFPSHILPRLEASFDEDNFQLIAFYLDLFTVYVTQDGVPPNALALLSFLTKNLESIRPGISNYSLERLLATSKIVDIVKVLANKILEPKKIEDKEVLWLREMALSLKPNTRIHLTNLWTKWGQSVPLLPDWTKEGFGLGKKLLSPSNEERRKVVTSTVKVLPSLVLCEWYLLGSIDTVDHEMVLPTVEALIDAILVAVQVPFLIKNPQITNNIIVNFSQFIWEKIIPKINHNSLKLNKGLKERISQLQDVLPEEVQKSRGPQIQLILQGIKENPITSN